MLEKSMSAYGQPGPKSAPGGAKERAGAGLVKRLRESTQHQSHQASSGNALLAGAGGSRKHHQGSADFSVTAVSEDDSGSRKTNDFDALVANFQQGLTLRKLQEELAASQSSMRRSEHAFRELAGKAGLR